MTEEDLLYYDQLFQEVGLEVLEFRFEPTPLCDNMSGELNVTGKSYLQIVCPFIGDPLAYGVEVVSERFWYFVFDGTHWRIGWGRPQDVFNGSYMRCSYSTSPANWPMDDQVGLSSFWPGCENSFEEVGHVKYMSIVDVGKRIGVVDFEKMLRRNVVRMISLHV